MFAAGALPVVAPSYDNAGPRLCGTAGELRIHALEDVFGQCRYIRSQWQIGGSCGRYMVCGDVVANLQQYSQLEAVLHRFAPRGWPYVGATLHLHILGLFGRRQNHGVVYREVLRHLYMWCLAEGSRIGYDTGEG